MAIAVRIVCAVEVVGGIVIVVVIVGIVVVAVVVVAIVCHVCACGVALVVARRFFIRFGLVLCIVIVIIFAGVVIVVVVVEGFAVLVIGVVHDDVCSVSVSAFDFNGFAGR